MCRTTLSSFAIYRAIPRYERMNWIYCTNWTGRILDCPNLLLERIFQILWLEKVMRSSNAKDWLSLAMKKAQRCVLSSPNFWLFFAALKRGFNPIRRLREGLLVA